MAPFHEKTFFFTKNVQKLPPWGPPKPTENSKKLKKEPPETELKKTLKTNTQNEPVLAMEREARLKEERDPNESQNVSCTSSGLRPRLLENSQKAPPRSKTRKHHRKNAKTLQK